ncbi:MAG: hypothetical protein R3E95_22040, partial [Thiolinea sp.]
IARKAGLVQRDGDVIDAGTGIDKLEFEGVTPGNYYVSVKHRNHLGTMTAGLVELKATPPLVDFTLPTTPVYGNYARIESKGYALLWAGNANSNKNLIANGPDQDTSILLGDVLVAKANSSFSTNYILEGYRATDLTLNGETVFAGPGNDVNLLLGNVLLHPGNSTFSANFIIQEQLP